jgi:hypothetical protein
MNFASKNDDDDDTNLDHRPKVGAGQVAFNPLTCSADSCPELNKQSARCSLGNSH